MVNVTKKKTGRNRILVVSELDKQIGENIRVLRQCNAMNQLALASKINVSAQQLAKYEKGENRISASSLLTIAGVLRVDVTVMYKESVISHKNNGGLKLLGYLSRIEESIALQKELYKLIKNISVSELPRGSLATKRINRISTKASKEDREL